MYTYTWILIITLFGPNVDSHVAVTSIEFLSQDRCEEARAVVLEHRPNGTSSGKLLNSSRSHTMMEAVCVRK